MLQTVLRTRKRRVKPLCALFDWVVRIELNRRRMFSRPMGIFASAIKHQKRFNGIEYTQRDSHRDCVEALSLLFCCCFFYIANLGLPHLFVFVRASHIYNTQAYTCHSIAWRQHSSNACSLLERCYYCGSLCVSLTHTLSS